MNSPETELRAQVAALRLRVNVLTLVTTGAVVLAAVALGRGGRAAAPEPEPSVQGVLTGRSLYLGDGPGERPYVWLKYLHDGAGLMLNDADGMGQVMLAASRDGGRLVLGGGLRLEGDRGRPALTLRDERAHERLILTGGDAPGRVLRDGAGRVRLELAAGADGPRLRVLGPRGEIEFAAPAKR